MSALTGKRILLVEDEALIAAMAQDMLQDLGTIVIGPATTVAKGLALAESEMLDAAVLDVNVRDERIDPVAELLRGKGIPMVFTTGYGAGAQVDAPRASIIDKPYTQERLAEALTAALDGSA